LRDANCVEISGRLIELEQLRYTPAGIPILRFRLGHFSDQQEAGAARKVECELSVVAIQREAQLIASATLGTPLIASGFLDRKSRSSSQLMLHATHIEFKNPGLGEK